MLSVPVLESDVYVKCTCSGEYLFWKVTCTLSVPVLESDVYVKCTCSGE